MKSKTAVAMAFCVIMLWGCTLNQAISALSDKFTGPSEAEKEAEYQKQVEQAKAEDEAKKQRFEAYKANLEQLRANIKSRPYGPDILGFRLGQTYNDVKKNADMRGMEYEIRGQGPYAMINVKDIRYAQFVDVLPDERLIEAGNNTLKKYGLWHPALMEQRGNATYKHFRITFNDEGYVNKIEIDDMGLRSYYSYNDHFLNAISRVANIKISGKTTATEYVNGYGARHTTYDTSYNNVYGNGWMIEVHTRWIKLVPR